MPLRSKGLCNEPRCNCRTVLLGSRLFKQAEKHRSGKPVSGTDEQIFLGDTIEKNYDPNVIMKRGEAFFDKEEYSRGYRRVQHFLELHRAHQLAVYAQFRIAESHLRIADQSIATRNPFKRLLPPSKSHGKTFRAANMRDRPFNV